MQGRETGRGHHPARIAYGDLVPVVPVPVVPVPVVAAPIAPPPAVPLPVVPVIAPVPLSVPLAGIDEPFIALGAAAQQYDG